jgi:heme-degrading monooxygenase HmoA
MACERAWPGGGSNGLALVLAVFVAVGSASDANPIPGKPDSPVIAAPAAAPVYQLRIYEIFDHNKAAFHARFRDHAVRIMGKYGFHIRSMWETRTDARTEFVYLLEWPSEAAMRESWAKFMADQEWARIKKETLAAHGSLVGEIQERVLHTLDYSPKLPPVER